MGATDFATRVPKYGRTAKQAFADAVSDAQHEYGHGGYTGTIAEKSGFTMVTPQVGETPCQCHDRLLRAVCGESRTSGWNPFDDKWGNAGCLDDGDYWIFFGLAST
jgi:hypothetical protein